MSGSKLLSRLKGEQVQEVLTKKVTVKVPYNSGPKRYCCLIKYTPFEENALQLNSSSQVYVSLSMKSMKCHTEDTHLFVRFGGYNYSTEKPYDFSVMKRWENSKYIFSV